MMLRWLTAAVLLLAFGGCAKQVDLPDITVSAASPGDFARFRSDLAERFTPGQLKDFDTATQELQLDAMNRDIATAAGRELDMLAVINGQPVHTVILLGWKARRARFLREIADLQKMLERDLGEQARTAATGTPEPVTRRLGSERDLLEQLHHNLAEAERRLAEMNQAKP